jgi:transposase-like protein
VPVLYRKEISNDEFQTALEAILGPQAKGLSEKRYVYAWVDGVYCSARLEDERSCLLVVMGADSSGKKELIAVSDGYRESTQSWKEILLDLHSRGLEKASKLAVCDGALGFQASAAEVWPKTPIQRCWFHKSGNVLDRLPMRWLDLGFVPDSHTQQLTISHWEIRRL